MARQGMTMAVQGRDGADFDIYHVAPAGKRKGGLVLIQEIFGVTDHIKDLCDRYAADGYEVLAPSLYDRGERGFNATYEQEDIDRSMELAGQFPPDTVLNDVQLCIDRLKDKGPVFMTGYCWGGAVCWLAACRCENLAAVSGYYGRLIVDYVDETPKCPTILHFGRHDASIPMSDVDKVKEAHPDIPVHVYDAGHGFNSDRRKDYNEQCAELAGRRTSDLFLEYAAP